MIIMKKTIISLLTIAALAACSGPAFDPASVADATSEQVSRVEPLSWWVGLKTDLQLLVQGEGISEYDVTIEGGKGVSVEKINKALLLEFMVSPNCVASNILPLWVAIMSLFVRRGFTQNLVRTFAKR